MDIFGISSFVILYLLLGTVATFKFNYTCDGSLRITCGQKPIILISVMSVTRQKWACSLAGSGDRNNRKENAVWRKCSGKSSCTIKSGMKLKDYKYLGIHYDCGKSYDMCSSVRIKAPKAYLQSPNYRQVFPYDGSTVCRCRAELTEPTRLVVGVQYKQFSSIDTHLMIQWREDEVLQIYEETDLSPGVIYRKTANDTFVVMFNANGRNGTGFFQVFYKASYPIVVTCNMDIRAVIPTILDDTKSVQIPPNTTPVTMEITTPLIATTTTTTSTVPPTTTTTATTTTTMTSTTTTTDATTTTTTEVVPVTTILTTMTTKYSTNRQETTEKAPTTSAHVTEVYKNTTEVPVIARVISTDPSLKVLGILIPALIGMSVLVAVTCIVTLVVLLLITRLKKRKKYCPRRASCENHVVSRSVYELEHPVPGKEEPEDHGNGVIEVSAPPSVDIEDENMKYTRDDNSGKGSFECNLSAPCVGSDARKVRNISEESLVMVDNVLYEEMDEIDEVTPGSPSLYATMDRGRKMWIEPPGHSDGEENGQGPATLEKGPSLIFFEGHETTLKQGQNDRPASNDSPVTLIDGVPKTETENGCQGQTDITLNCAQGQGQSGDHADDNETDTSDSDAGLNFNIPEYACVKKPKVEPPAPGENIAPGDGDSMSENSELVFGNGDLNEPDYEEIRGPAEGDLGLDQSRQPLIAPSTGKSANHCAYMSVDVTTLDQQEMADRHIYEQV